MSFLHAAGPLMASESRPRFSLRFFLPTFFLPTSFLGAHTFDVSSVIFSSVYAKVLYLASPNEAARNATFNVRPFFSFQ